jgi:hypothetical protein
MIVSTLSLFLDTSLLAWEAFCFIAHLSVCNVSIQFIKGTFVARDTLLTRSSRSNATRRRTFHDIHNVYYVLRMFLIRHLTQLFAIVGDWPNRTISLHNCRLRHCRGWAKQTELTSLRLWIYYHYLQDPTFHQIAYAIPHTHNILIYDSPVSIINDAALVMRFLLRSCSCEACM